MYTTGLISRSQVNAWFANKRNRTNSTRPKRKKRELEEHLVQLCEYIYQSRSAPSSSTSSAATSSSSSSYCTSGSGPTSSTSTAPPSPAIATFEPPSAAPFVSEHSARTDDFLNSTFHSIGLCCATEFKSLSSTVHSQPFRVPLSYAYAAPSSLAVGGAGVGGGGDSQALATALELQRREQCGTNGPDLLNGLANAAAVPAPISPLSLALPAAVSPATAMSYSAGVFYGRDGLPDLLGTHADDETDNKYRPSAISISTSSTSPPPTSCIGAGADGELGIEHKWATQTSTPGSLCPSLAESLSAESDESAASDPDIALTTAGLSSTATKA